MPRPLPRALRAHNDAALRAKNDPPAAREPASARPSPRPRPRPHPVAAPEDGYGGEASTARVPFAGASTRLVAALTALAVVLAVGLGVLFWQGHRSAAAAGAGADAHAAARSAAETLFSYDYRTIDANITAGKKVVTGVLAKDYDATSKVVKPTAVDTKAIVKATVSESGVVSASSDRVVVLLYLNQATQNKNVQGTRMDLNRVRVTMVRVGGDWKISRAEPL
jgi:Mce-associated membrane protein